MNRNETLRLLVLILAGGSAYATLSAWKRDQESDDGNSTVVAAVAGSASRAPSAARHSEAEAASAPSAPSALLARARSLPSAEAGAFASMHWLPPPPPPPPPAPPPAPVAPPPPAAPPMPFTFVGMLESGAPKPQAYLARGDTLVVVSQGDLIDQDRYRIDELSPAGVVMTYLPLNIRQTVAPPGPKP